MSLALPGSSSAAPFAPPSADPMADDDPIWPISVEMYQEMIRLGVIDEDARVYLWKGRLAQDMPTNPPHSDAVKAGYDRIARLLPDGYEIDRERPMAMGRHPSAPEPDLAIIRDRFREFSPKLFPSSRVALLVEVAETSLAKDRRHAFAYAAEGVPVYWIVNLVERQVEIHSDPAEGAYRTRTVHDAEAEAPVILDGREVGRLRVADLLP